MGSAQQIAAVITAGIGILTIIYAIITKLIVGPMIKAHINTLFDKIDERYISRKEIALMQAASDETHRRTTQEIRDIWAEINRLKIASH